MEHSSHVIERVQFNEKEAYNDQEKEERKNHLEGQNRNKLISSSTGSVEKMKDNSLKCLKDRERTFQL